MVIIIVRKQLHKIVPESIDIIVTPTISLLVIGLATIFLIMPVAGAISNGLVGIINVVLEKVAGCWLYSWFNLLANGNVWFTSNFDANPH